MLDVIKKRFSELGMSNGFLSEKMKVSKVTIWKMFAGKQDIRIKDIQQFSSIAKCAIDIKVKGKNVTITCNEKGK